MFLRLGKNDNMRKKIPIIIRLIDKLISKGKLISKNKVFLFYEGDHRKLEQQITAAIAEIILNEMLYGNEFKDNLANSTLLNLPRWYLPGLISYISNNWDFEVENPISKNEEYSDQSYPVYRVQVKSTSSRNESKLTYSNLLKLIQYTGASFIALIKYSTIRCMNCSTVSSFSTQPTKLSLIFSLTHPLMFPSVYSFAAL